jgi:hypothetical protein
MASNAELRAEAEALGVELGVSVDVADMSNAKLRSLVSDLYEQLAAKDAEADPAPEPTLSPPPSAPAPEPRAQRPPRHEYTVAPGVCFSCGPRGLRKPGDEVILGDFGEDEHSAREQIDLQIAAGRVIRRP